MSQLTIGIGSSSTGFDKFTGERTQFIDFINTLAQQHFISVQDYFKIIFGDSFAYPSDIDSQTHFEHHIRDLINIFNTGSDGKINFEFYKSYDVTKLMTATLKLVNIIHLIESDLSGLTVTSTDILDIGFKIIMYAIFLPLSQCDQGFIDYIKVDENRQLIAQLLNMIYSSIQSSTALGNVANDIVSNLSKGCSCCSSQRGVDAKLHSLSTERMRNIQSSAK